MNSRTPLRILAVALIVVLTAPAVRAGFVDSAPAGLLDGLAHPFRGIDHVALLLAAGAWAAQLGRRARWTVPAMFVSISACGAALGLTGMEPAMLQTMAMMALLTFTLLVLGPVRWTFALVAAPLGVAAFFHGMAHAAQLAAGADGLGFTGGLILASAALYAIGFFTGVAVGDWIHHHHGDWTGHGRVAH